MAFFVITTVLVGTKAELCLELLITGTLVQRLALLALQLTALFWVITPRKIAVQELTTSTDWEENNLPHGAVKL